MDLCDSEDMNLFGTKESSASSAASSVIRFSGPAHRQNWSLPDSIIFYIAKNPSTPKLYQKLIRTCKYFFLINPIVICSDLELRCREMDGDSDDESEDGNNEEEDLSNNEETNNEDAAVDATDDYWEMTQLLVKKNGFFKKVNKKIDLKNYSAKIWIVKFDDFEGSNLEMHDSVTNKSIVSSIIHKIYRCNVKKLELCRQNLSFAEFSFLASSALTIWLDEVTVKYDDGTVVPVEKIVECVAKATVFQIEFHDNDASISSETVKHLLQISHFSNIESFCLQNVPGSFDIETFVVYLKNNKSATFGLTFSNAISAAYKNRLEKIIDEILEAGGQGGYKSPFIGFPGLDKDKKDKIFILYCGLFIS